MNDKILENVQIEVQKATLGKLLNSSNITAPEPRKPRLSDKVYDYVVQQICDGKLTRGQRIVERVLAKDLSISPIPVREALRNLTSNGWLEHIPHKGTFVREFNINDITEIYKIREIIETGAARSVAETRTIDQLVELKHVLDLIEAHILTLEKIIEDPGGYLYNVGTGTGNSNKEVVEMVEKVSGQTIKVREESRRAGDPNQLVADPARIKAELGFEPKYSDLETIVESAWRWHTSKLT